MIFNKARVVFSLILLAIIPGQVFSDIPFPDSPILFPDVHIRLPDVPIRFPDTPIPFPKDPTPQTDLTSQQPPSFLGKKQTTLNVEHLGDRHYSNTMARFLSIDREKALVSLYAYTAGDPIAFSDPTGFGPPGSIIDEILDEIVDENNEDTRGIDRQGVHLELITNMEDTAAETPGGAPIEVNVVIQPPSPSSLGSQSRNQLFGTRDREQNSYGDDRRVNLTDLKLLARDKALERRALRQRGSILTRNMRSINRIMFGMPRDDRIMLDMEDPAPQLPIEPEPTLAANPPPSPPPAEIDMEADLTPGEEGFFTGDPREQLGSSFVGYQDQFNIPRRLYDNPDMPYPGMSHMPDDPFAVGEAPPVKSGWSTRKKVALGLGIGAGVAVLGGIGYGIYVAIHNHHAPGPSPAPGPGPGPAPKPNCRTWIVC